MRCLVLACWFCAAGAAQTFNCDLSAYKPVAGIKAEMRNGALEVAWDGAPGQQLRAAFVVRGGQPTIAELLAHKDGGNWVRLGRNLVPEFQVTSGKRRL